MAGSSAANDDRSKLKMAGAASLYRDRKLEIQRDSNNSDLAGDRKIHIQETMDWANGGLDQNTSTDKVLEDSYENRRTSNLDKYK